MRANGAVVVKEGRVTFFVQRTSGIVAPFGWGVCLLGEEG
jgi:hypothetical protein